MANTYAIGKIELPGGDICNLVGAFPYGECATAAGTAAKEVTCENFTALSRGLTVHVKFQYSNTVASPTLNVNGTGAKTIYRYGTTKPSTSATTSWNAGALVSLTYDGTCWRMNDWLNNNTWTALKGATALAAGTAGYAPAPPSEGYDTKFLRADGTWAVPAGSENEAATAAEVKGYLGIS